ncbi:MAG: serine/threonine protein kinase, partial [Anaerolineae bacterium]|nr:serine/threonine protein kinase [Anaerolineae bacterium]
MNPASLIGKTIGQYEIEAVLGQGGMGAVFRAVQLNLRRRVAVKVILENLSDKPDYLERFNREAQLVAALEHPHIVTVYDFGMEYVESVGDVMFVAMRLLEGGSLEKRIRQREGVPQTLDEVADLVSGICSALDHAHSMGVIHRDIKPANIVFDRLSIDAKAYLVDFGIAKTMGGGGSLTNANVAMGSPYYMPPEQWKNEAIKPASD